MRVLLAILLSCIITAAHAGNPGPCPSFHAGWALSGAGPITGILWDQYTKQMYFIWSGMPTSVYCVLYNQDLTRALATETGVPLRTDNPFCPTTTGPFVSDYYPVADFSVMQAFSQTPQQNWVQTFNFLIAPRYHAILLQDVDNCPVLQEFFSFVCNLEAENGTQPIATEANVALFTEGPTCSTTPGGFVWVN